MGFPELPCVLDRDLVFEFFWKFSVFESALKRAGFLKREHGTAEANWDKFARYVKDHFTELKLTSPTFCEAVDRIKRLSPRKQINNGRCLAWEPVNRQDNDSDAAYTLRLLKTVRNNLFHGGKYPDRHEFEIARNQAILRAALSMLEGCYELDQDVKAAIDEVVADIAA